ncbi:hypothetical protein [Undibacterium luofuense]|uniref:Uncharacterized protein n=1 Tax=Undibacterium luofuense TaxID=2828733 RepID=A0A941I4N1_9BURK|nr:hypothetical protein [Undibacterium luofuense]MBR7781872.1 hypothetical protein [Undibacterium luofuense]
MTPTLTIFGNPSKTMTGVTSGNTDAINYTSSIKTVVQFEITSRYVMVSIPENQYDKSNNYKDTLTLPVSY